MVYTILVIAQVMVALVLIGLILVQHGKGADAGAAFGSGASGTVFGAKGSANFMTRATGALATVFFVISLTLAYLINGASTPTGSVTDQVQQPAPKSSLLSHGDNKGNSDGVPGAGTLTGSQSMGDSKQNAPQALDSGGQSKDQGNVPGNGQGKGGNGGVDSGAKIPD